MKKVIYIFLKRKKQQKPIVKEFDNGRFRIIIAMVDFREDRYIWSQRANAIYCDVSFTTSREERDYIQEVIKPSANLGDREFYLI